VSTDSQVARYMAEVPSVESYWRAIVLFGRNVASYKFALAGALLELADGPEAVPLDVLALPFATRLARHLQTNDKQGTFQRSQFLDACRGYNRGETDDDGLREATVRLGFTNVIDAFHVVDNQDVAERFFVDERRTANGIRLADGLRSLLQAGTAPQLEAEVEARWRLVETSWELSLPRSALTVGYDRDSQQIVVPRRRTAITGARDALNGYQKGHCFYCFERISIVSGDSALADVDHVFAWSLDDQVGEAPVDGVWNLVLACKRCNASKSDRPPSSRHVERLGRRNEFLISSHHPLRPTLIAQIGRTETERARTLGRAHQDATAFGARQSWAPDDEGPARF
jgi:5-methylcytosine-specific restriction endonuclease McrA